MTAMDWEAMTWPRLEYFTLCVLLCLKLTISDVLDSDSLFQLNWRGPNIQELSTDAEYVVMTTPANEKYHCFLPDEDTRRHQNEVHYDGPSAAKLMQPVLSKSVCTIRIETYWNFELCHGEYVRQYHEEKEAGKEIKLLEFYLGKDMKSSGAEHEIQTMEEFHGTYDKFKVPTIPIDGKDVPYYEVLMEDGTPCDLRGNTPRLTRVRYVCDVRGRMEMLTIKETSTCEYEAVVLVSHLCNHPLYKVRETLINAINCRAMDGAPARPVGYDQLYKDTSSRTQLPPKTLPTATSSDTPMKSAEAHAKQRLPIPVLIDKQILQDFLTGDYCLHGGQGWWKYEFCYGKFAQQYHSDKNGRTVVLMGSWKKEDHVAWWTGNKKDIGPTSVTHFYGNGDVCDLTGKPRTVQVKLKCKESMQPSAVTIYLTEPKDCEYVLGVDSPIICSLLDSADEYGILHPRPLDDVSSDKTTKTTAQAP